MSSDIIINSKSFYKRNSKVNKLSKDVFFIEFYRILHTAYLINDGSIPCKETLLSEFSKTFSTLPDAKSIQYIDEFSKCFSSDGLINSIKAAKPYHNLTALKSLAIEIGFDVWLIENFEKGKKFRLNHFKKWLPLKRDYEFEIILERFLDCRIPNIKKKIRLLYDYLKPYSNMIYTFYGNILYLNGIPGAVPVNMLAVEKEENKETTTVEDVTSKSVPESEEFAESIECAGVPSDDITPDAIPDNTIQKKEMDEALKAVEIKEVLPDSTEFFARIKSNDVVLNEKSIEILNNIKLEEPKKDSHNRKTTPKIRKIQVGINLPKKEQIIAEIKKDLSDKRVKSVLAGIAVASIVSVPFALYLSKKN